MKLFYRILMLAAIAAIKSNVLFSANANWTWNSNSNTSWTTKSNWVTTDNDASPASNDTIIINSGFSVYPALGANRTVAKLVINGGSITFGSSTLTVVNHLILNSGSFSIGNNIVISNNMTVNAGILNLNNNETVGGNMTVNGGTVNGNTENLTIDGLLTLNAGIMNFNGSDIVVNGNGNGNDLIINGGTLNIYGADLGVEDDIVLQGGTINVTNSNLSVENDLFLISGTLDLNSRNLSVADDFTIEGTGSISNPGSVTVENLIVDLIGTYTLNYDLQVNNEADFNNGYIHSSINNLIVFDHNATVASVSDASHVNGPVRKLVQASGNTSTFAFPVGNGVRYALIEISGLQQTQNGDYFTAVYLNQEHMFANGNVQSPLVLVSKAEHWILDRGNNNITPTTDAYVRLSYNETNRSGLVDSKSQLSVSKWDAANSEWLNLGNGNTSGSDAIGTVRSLNRVTSFSPFTLGSTSTLSPLPVHIIDFTAKAADKLINVNWTSSNEINNDYFSVEKSLDGINWIEIGKVDAAMNPDEINNYTLADHNPFAGVQFYRLKQYDLNAEFTYSSIVSVKYGAVLSVSLFPNPANDVLNVTVSNEEASEVSVRIFDIHGKVVLKVSESTNTINGIDISKLESGIYTVLVQTDGISETKTLIIK